MKPRNAKRVLSLIAFFCDCCHLIWPWKRWLNEANAFAGRDETSERACVWIAWSLLWLAPGAIIGIVVLADKISPFWLFTPSAVWSVIALFNASYSTLTAKVAELEQIAKMPEGALEDEKNKKGAVSIAN